jgi:hypothetical protein
MDAAIEAVVAPWEFAILGGLGLPGQRARERKSRRVGLTWRRGAYNSPLVSFAFLPPAPQALMR